MSWVADLWREDVDEHTGPTGHAGEPLRRRETHFVGDRCPGGHKDDPRGSTVSTGGRLDTARASRCALMDQIARHLGLEEAMTREVLSLFLEDLVVFEQRHRDYGPDNINATGERGVFVRCMDKLARLKTLVWGDKVNPDSEPVEDSWRDLSMYGYIARIVRAGRWG